jgi:hypothetical protein
MCWKSSRCSVELTGFCCFFIWLILVFFSVYFQYMILTVVVCIVKAICFRIIYSSPDRKKGFFVFTLFFSEIYSCAMMFSTSLYVVSCDQIYVNCLLFSVIFLSRFLCIAKKCVVITCVNFEIKFLCFCLSSIVIFSFIFLFLRL